MNKLYLSNISPWAPGLTENIEDWKLWAKGEKEIDISKDAPKLEYTDPLFRRRLSQISRMTVQVVHNLLENTGFDKETKIVFSSLRGEIEREFTIDKSLIEDGMILPAGFSLSVFNTPVALATLAFKLTGGYSVLYPSKNNFADAFKTAVAPVLAGTEKQIVFVYADEIVPPMYGDKIPQNNTPCAFACLISSQKPEISNGSSNSSSENIVTSFNSFVEIESLESISSIPEDFLRNLINKISK